MAPDPGPRRLPMRVEAEQQGAAPLLAGARRAYRRAALRLRQRGDSEAEQALIRVVLGVVASLYMLTADLGRAHAHAETVITAVAWLFLSAAMLLLVAAVWSARPSPVRRCVGILVDLSATSTALAFAGETGAPLLAVYLWVIVGNGFRYGAGYLAFATGVSLLGLGAAIAFSPFWRTHLLFSASFMLVLVLIPGYVAALLEKLRAAIRDADESNQAKSAFLAKMSHELRTPLNGIIGVSDLLREGALHERERELVQTIHSSGETLLGIIDNILDLSRIEAGHVTIEQADLSLQRLVAETVAMFEPQAQRKGVALRSAITGRIPQRLIGDPLHIRQVLMNLLGNALKFTEQGTVWVRLLPAPDQDDPDRLTVRFEVEDSGPGIAAGEQGRIFDRFHQAAGGAARGSGGVGLGTAIARELVQRMGGRIGLRSELGEGSLFWFELPLLPVSAPDDPLGADAQSVGAGQQVNARETVVSLANYYRSVAPAGGEQLHLLVAEDNATNRRVLRAVLEQAGHRLTVVEDGEAALDALQDLGCEIDLLVLDKRMPGLDGLEVFRAQRFLQPDAPIPTIMLSADATEQSIQECLAAGVDAYLTKPVASRRLLETVASLARQRAVTADGADSAASERSSSGGAEPPLVDAEKLASIRQLGLGEDDAFFEDMIECFRVDAERGLTAIADALCAEDYPALRAAVHALEGSAQELGAVGVAVGTDRLRALKPFELGSARAQALLTQLRALVARTLQLLRIPGAQGPRGYPL